MKIEKYKIYNTILVLIVLIIISTIMYFGSRERDPSLPNSGETWLLKDSSTVYVLTYGAYNNYNVKVKDGMVVEIPGRMFLKKIK